MAMLVGFVTDHDPISDALRFPYYRRPQTININRQLLVDYLNSGVFVFGWMRAELHIITGEAICVSEYLTDGLWLWPRYYQHYIAEFPNFWIDPDFAQHVINADYKMNEGIHPSLLFQLEELILQKFQ